MGRKRCRMIRKEGIVYYSTAMLKKLLWEVMVPIQALYLNHYIGNTNVWDITLGTQYFASHRVGRCRKDPMTEVAVKLLGWAVWNYYHPSDLVSITCEGRKVFGRSGRDGRRLVRETFSEADRIWSKAAPEEGRFCGWRDRRIKSRRQPVEDRFHGIPWTGIWRWYGKSDQIDRLNGCWDWQGHRERYRKRILKAPKKVSEVLISGNGQRVLKSIHARNQNVFRMKLGNYPRARAAPLVLSPVPNAGLYQLSQIRYSVTERKFY